MKIQLDTNQKTIRVEESVNLNEFMKAVKNLFPNNEWKEYRIETNTVINWGTYPIYYEPQKFTPYWWEQPYTICDGKTVTTGERVYGVYNI